MNTKHSAKSTPDIINIIVHRATSLWELMRQQNDLQSTQNSEARVDQLIERWCQVVAKGDRAIFRKRLECEGWSLESVQRCLTLAPNSLPDWAETLSKLLLGVAEYQLEKPISRSNSSEQPFPFEELLLPLVYGARQQLLEKLGKRSLEASPLNLLSEPAYIALEHHLLNRLLALCSSTLTSEFARFRPLGHNLLNILVGQTDCSDNQQYKTFVQQQLDDHLISLFLKYPVLAKLIAIVSKFWVESTSEFLHRLDSDLPSIQIHFLGATSEAIGKIVTISPPLSDPHHQGRRVIAVTFENGLKLVYKPKNLGLEVAFDQVLEWCNDQSLSLNLLGLNVLNCGTHGWVEWVEHQPCLDRSAAQRFYQRAGMLLCLLYVLRCTDCHYENLIAHGEYLVMIDLETLMCPDPDSLDQESDPANVAVNQMSFWNSVLRTGMLPSWEIQLDSKFALDISGLGSVDTQQNPTRMPRWQAVNTDDMHLASEQVSLKLRENIPRLNDINLSPNEFVEELVSGFQEMYDMLLQNYSILLSPNSPVAVLRNQYLRFVFRGTEKYSRILTRSLSCDYLKDGIERSIELDHLSRPLLSTHEKTATNGILHAELEALEQLDIPRFEVHADQSNLMWNGQTVAETFFQKTSYSQVLSQLQSLSKKDLDQQIRIIRGAFNARVARFSDNIDSQRLAPATLDSPDVELLSREQFLQKAQAIALQFQESALHHPDGSVSWIGLSYLPKVERYQLQPINEGLYSGSCGVTLFLSALDYITGSDQFRDLTIGALQPLRYLLQTANHSALEAYLRRIGIGFAEGIGGILYALVCTSRWLKDQGLIEDAERLASGLTETSIQGDQSLDIISGAAGTILGLLAIYTSTKNPAILEKAVLCGEHLVRQQVVIDRQAKAWNTLDGNPLTGFSHGAAGISYALLRLYAVTKNNIYLSAAESGIQFEQTAFIEAVSNWLDLRHDNSYENHRFMASWCHGAPGIALARLGGISILRSSLIDRDLESALLTTQKQKISAVNHLCCGNFGRIEILLKAAETLASPELFEIARHQGSCAIAQAKKLGNYQVFANLPNAWNPGFFDGVAGIGYTLLRFFASSQLPCVLLGEST